MTDYNSLEEAFNRLALMTERDALAQQLAASEPRVSIEQCVALKETAEILKGVSDSRIARGDRLGIEPKPVEDAAEIEALRLLLSNQPCDDYHAAVAIHKAGYRVRPAPAGVVLPERVLLRDSTGVSWATKDGWNACLDEVARLNNI